jgi:hypothetical protein
MYQLSKIKKRGAIELSIGTIVIIVLAVSMLILGVVLIRTIFSSGIDSVKQIDSGVKNSINKLFSEDNTRRLILFPDSGIIRLEQGSTGEGFAISIRNTDTGAKPSRFGYQIGLEDSDIASKCGIDDDPTVGTTAFARITEGRELNPGSGVTLSPGRIMEDPIHIRFAVNNDAPICSFRLKVEVYKNAFSPTNVYETKFMDVNIIPS